jgi:hypothetical protein
MTVEVQSPVDWAAVEVALVDWVEGVCPQLNAVIFGRQNGVQPNRPFAWLDFGANTQLGDDDLRYTFDALAVPPAPQYSVMISGQRLLVLSVNVVSNTTAPAGHASRFAERLRISLALPETLEPLRVAGIALSEAGPIQDLTAIEADDWVSRAQFDLRLGLAANIEVPGAKSPIINVVEVSGPTIGNSSVIDGGDPL